MKRLAIIVASMAAILAVAVVSSDGLRWRSQILLHKASGEITELSWSEIIGWMGPDGPVYLDLLLYNPNPDIVFVDTRFTSAEDIESGREFYGRLCTGCHGGSGEGITAPSLARSTKALSLWSMYKAIQEGVPGTSMPPHDLDDKSLWQIVAYVSSLAEASSFKVDAPIPDIEPISFERIGNAEPENWLTYSGRYEGWRYSELDEIDRDNIDRLKLRWVYQSKTTYDRIEATPIVSNGIMFITEPPGRVVALDADTGETLWEYERPVPERIGLCCGVVNRGVAVLGETVFVATIDAHLLALDMRSGSLLWETEVADHRQGYSITSAPLAIDGLIVTGVAGGEVGAKGFLDAYDAATGTRQWRFDTVPDPGQPGSGTWTNDLWQIGGAATWMTGSYDAGTDTIYWGTGHSVHEPEGGSGDKLYGSSILALRGQTGELLWHFLATPDDIHGFDAAQIPILIDAPVGNQDRKLLINGNRNAYFYVLDRESGDYLLGRPFANQTWSHGLDNNGRPIVNPDARPSPEGTLTWPNNGGATNWWPPAYSPRTGTVCLPVIDSPSIYYTQETEHVPGEPFVRVVGRQVLNQPIDSSIRCIDAISGELNWRTDLDASSEVVMGGLLATAGDLLFAGAHHNFLAFDIETGEELWRVGTGGNVVAAPISYQAGGRQQVTVAAGRLLLSFSLSSP